MLCLVMRYRRKVVVIIDPVVFLLIEIPQFAVSEPAELHPGLSNSLTEILIYSVPETTSLIGLRADCFAACDGVSEN